MVVLLSHSNPRKLVDTHTHAFAVADPGIAGRGSWRLCMKL